MKKLKLIIIIITVLFTFGTFLTVPTLHSFGRILPALNGNEAKQNWSKTLCKEKSVWGNTITTPLLAGDNLYAACENYLYQLDKSSGAVIKEITLAGQIDYSYTITYGDNMIFVPINNGRIQAISKVTGKSLWVSEGFAGYSSNCTPTYYNGKLYSAISKDSYDTDWNPLGSDGIVYCLDVKDNDTANEYEIKNIEWKAEDKEGHYWTTPLVQNNMVLIGSDTGSISCFNRENGKLLYYNIISDKGINAGITYDSATGTFYTVSKNAEAISFEVDATEGITVKKIVPLKPGTETPSYTHSTSTPVLSNNKIYILSNYENTEGNIVGLINILDKDLNVKKQINFPVMSQSTPYVLHNINTGYIYFTGNDSTGALYCATDSGTVQTVFIPSENTKQYCCSSVISDSSGNLYYSNDSGTVFAVGKKVLSTALPVTSPSTQPKDKKISTLSKVTSLKVTILKKRHEKNLHRNKRNVKFSWKKVSGAKGYQICLKKSNQKKFKKIATVSKISFSKSFKKGIYWVKVRAYKKVNGKNYFGKFSVIKKLKIKK